MKRDIKDAAWNSLNVEHSFPVEGQREGCTQECGRQTLGWTQKGPQGVPRVEGGRGQETVPTLTHLVFSTPAIPIKNNMAIKRAYQKSPCSL